MVSEKQFIKKKCIICEKIYYTSRRKGKGKKAVFLRPRNSRTCSRKCSRIYSDPTIRKKVFPKLP